VTAVVEILEAAKVVVMAVVEMAVVMVVTMMVVALVMMMAVVVVMAVMMAMPATLVAGLGHIAGRCPQHCRRRHQTEKNTLHCIFPLSKKVRISANQLFHCCLTLRSVVGCRIRENAGAVPVSEKWCVPLTYRVRGPRLVCF
jgi:hypothetical protein